jgi:hypothetical protein
VPKPLKTLHAGQRGAAPQQQKDVMAITTVLRRNNKRA